MTHKEDFDKAVAEWQAASQRWVDKLEATQQFWLVGNITEQWTYITDNIDCTPPDAESVERLINPINFQDALRHAKLLERLGHYVNVQIGDDFYESPEPKEEVQVQCLENPTDLTKHNTR